MKDDFINVQSFQGFSEMCKIIQVEFPNTKKRTDFQNLTVISNKMRDSGATQVVVCVVHVEFSECATAVSCVRKDSTNLCAIVFRFWKVNGGRPTDWVGMKQQQQRSLSNVIYLSVSAKEFDSNCGV